ncbi:MAG: Tm-1-like ATP-binding domain-containing protein [Burkholderiaceae bacterium]|nr:Tm-1-like ATP-binding domain-containing protein [Burkholderiaceae bacterium]
MATTPRILLVGTADTKADELLYLQRCIAAQGGAASIMDVGILGTPSFAPAIPNHAVAAAAHTTLEALAALGDENAAMTKMAEGAVALALDLYARGEAHGLLALGGTMGTDLALDVTAALPLGMPKFIVSTVAYSHLIPPERLAPDLMMILWAGGLYGLNGICEAILSQAAGAVVGACRSVELACESRPRVAISSLGKSCLSYMVRLAPALVARGYEPVVFHCTGMGGRAMEALVAQRRFVAVFDFCLAEVANMMHGSVVNAGPHRLSAAGLAGVPQLVAPGASDMVDIQTWAERPAQFAGRAYHAHNRLIASVNATTDEKRRLATLVCERLGEARGPTALLLPQRGIHAWDKPGQPMHDPEGHAAFLDAFRAAVRAPVELHEIDAHINDDAFVDRALAIFDRWVGAGQVPAGVRAD